MDLAEIKIPQPEIPDFGDDEAGKVAAFMYDQFEFVNLGKNMSVAIREWRRSSGAARVKTHRAWRSMLEKLQADPNMLVTLDHEGLLDALNDVSKLILKKRDLPPDPGGQRLELHTLLSKRAADKFYPDWQDNIASVVPTLIEALKRVGVIDNDDDKTGSIRVTLQGYKKELAAEKRAAQISTTNW